MPRPTTPAPDDEQLHPLAFLRTQQPAPTPVRPARRTAAKRATPAKPAPQLAAPPGPSDPEPPAFTPPVQHRPAHRHACCCTHAAGSRAPLLYTVEQAADLLALPAHWLQRAAGDGRIPATYIGKYLRFCDADLDELIARSRRRPDPAFDPRLDT